MSVVVKESRIGFAGGRRVELDEMAKDENSRQELKQLLLLMEAIELEDSVSEADRGPVDSQHNLKAVKAA